MHYDCIIIGAGVAGMTSALLLARSGRRTLLLERSSRVAPTLRGFSRQGVQFDTGLHYLGGLGDGEPLDVYFRHLGLGALPRTSYDASAVDRLRFLDSGRELSLPSGYEAVHRSLCGRFPAEEGAIAAYLGDVRKSFDSSPFLNFDLTPGEQSMQGDALDTLSLAAYLDERFKDPKLKAALAISCLLYGTSPKDAPFSLHAKIAGSYYLSAHGLAGGGKTLVDAYEAAMAKAGVDVLTGTGAAALELGDDKAVRAVTTEDGRSFATSACIATVHPATMLAMMPPGTFRPAYHRRIGSIPATPSAHMLFGLAEPPVPELAQSNIIACPNADIASFFEPGRQPGQGPFYVSATSPLKGGGQPQGIVAIAPGEFAQVQAWADTRRGRRPQDYADYKARALGEMRAALGAACPELAGVRHVDGATPLTLRDWMDAPNGALYGARHSIHHFNPQPMTRVPGLFLAGQSVVAPGVLGAVVSGYLAGGLVTGFPPLWKELRQCR